MFKKLTLVAILVISSQSFSMNPPAQPAGSSSLATLAMATGGLIISITPTSVLTAIAKSALAKVGSVLMAVATKENAERALAYAAAKVISK